MLNILIRKDCFRSEYNRVNTNYKVIISMFIICVRTCQPIKTCARCNTNTPADNDMIIIDIVGLDGNRIIPT